MPTIHPTVTVVTPPSSMPVSLAEAKLQLRIDGSEQDGLLAGLIEAATAQCERRLGQSLAVQELAYLCINSGQDGIVLPGAPVTEIIEVEGLAETGESIVIEAGIYRLLPDRRTLLADCTDAAAHLRITYRAGYEPDELPADLRQAVLLQVRALYEDGELGERLNRQAESLLQPSRELRI